MKDFLVFRFKLIVTTFLIALGALGGCSKDPTPVKGFVLPEGDIDAGKEVFASIGCRYCHTIAEVELPAFGPTPVLQIELGGQVHRVNTYGELLTSIVNPDHKVLAKHRQLLPEEAKEQENSPMPDFNDGMTVRELIDLTAFLHSRYEQLSPRYQGYKYYYGP